MQTVATYSIAACDPGEWLEVDDRLAAELRERLERLGYEGDLDTALQGWAGT
jgi:hypothetical protein